MLQDKCMPYQKTCLHSYQSIGISCTSMLMKMFLWVPGSSVLMSSILMKGASAMGLLKIASGRPKLVIHVLHPLTGVAVVFANQRKGWRRFISTVGRVMELCGTVINLLL